MFKEKEFIMKESLNQLLDTPYDDKIMVQGVVDLFVVNGKNAVLVDYKYSSTKSQESLIERYKNQLKLYKLAITNGLSLTVDKVYLLSLKYCQLIEINV